MLKITHSSFEGTQPNNMQRFVFISGLGAYSEVHNSHSENLSTNVNMQFLLLKMEIRDIHFIYIPLATCEVPHSLSCNCSENSWKEFEVIQKNSPLSLGYLTLHSFQPVPSHQSLLTLVNKLERKAGAMVDASVGLRTEFLQSPLEMEYLGFPDWIHSSERDWRLQEPF